MGFDMDLNKLYPEIQLPVSRCTPMLSPLIRWNHKKDFDVLVDKQGGTSKFGANIIQINLKNENWSFISGYILHGMSNISK